MFLLPNGSVIDIEGVCDALDDYRGSAVYFLDSITGEVGEVGVEEVDTVIRLDADTRYFKVPVTPTEKQLLWLREFISGMLPKRSRLAKVLLKHIETKNPREALEECESLLDADESPDDWFDAWAIWAGDELYAEAEEWFSTLPIEIVDKFEGCDDCELCKLMEQDEHTVGDFFEAASKQKMKSPDAVVSIGTPVGDLRSEKVEMRITILFARYKVDTTPTEVRRWVYESKDITSAHGEFQAKFLALFPSEELAHEESYLEMFGAAVDAWNVFPHKVLGDKSPQDMLRNFKGKK